MKSILLVGALLAIPLPMDPAAQRDLPTLEILGGKEIYAKHCAACHGQTGKGDGVVAKAFDPPPVDFTDREFMSDRTDEQLLASIKDGKGSMPAFSAVLEPAQLDDTLRYIRGFLLEE